MLAEHFKLSTQPFGVTPDPRFLYLSKTHREALASLLYGIQSGRGFVALIAPPGMGKTTLLFHILGLLMANTKTAFLFQTLCGPEEFLRTLLADLGIDNTGDMASMHSKLNGFLMGEAQSGRKVVVVVDEAQNLDVRVLELIRMLSNFETAGKKLLHLVLAGQPQLAQKLASDELTQLRQRISIIATLAPFTESDTNEYIAYRLRVAGLQSDGHLFSDAALSMIAKHSRGVPREINNICFNSMTLACAERRTQVDSSMVQETLNDLNLSSAAIRGIPAAIPNSSDANSRTPRSRHVPRSVILGGLLAVAVSVLAYLSVHPSRFASGGVNSPGASVSTVVQPTDSLSSVELPMGSNQQQTAGTIEVQGQGAVDRPPLPPKMESRGRANRQPHRSKRTPPKTRLKSDYDQPLKLDLAPLPIGDHLPLSGGMDHLLVENAVLGLSKSDTSKKLVPSELDARGEKQ